MSRTSYCKKCACDVPVGDTCPNCGGKLTANAVRLSWCVDHNPVCDWMCWNAILRLVLPVMGVTLGLTVLLELFMSGLNGVGVLLSGGLLVTLGGMLALLLVGMLLVFLLQGEDVLDCVIDGQGIHVQQYLQDATPITLLMRGKSPQLLDATGEEAFVFLGRWDIPWKDVRRVQLWPEKCMILFYGEPKFWLRLPLPCTAFTWPEALDFIQEKIGKKKAVDLPVECRIEEPAKAPKGKQKSGGKAKSGQKAEKSTAKAKKSAPRTENRQFTIDDLPPQPIPEEEVPPELREQA